MARSPPARPLYFDVTAKTPCFVRGTAIQTANGEVAVENLSAGDLLVVTQGGLRPIVWIGHRTVGYRTRHRSPHEVYPVRVAAHAFGEGLPRRDLWLSPGHNVAAEGVIMPIAALINDRSVAQVKRDKVEYWHVELDAHDILLAEGLPAKSFYSIAVTGPPSATAAPSSRRIRTSSRNTWAQTCLPLVKQGPEVANAKARLLARLANQGHGVNDEPNAHITVDGGPDRSDASLQDAARLRAARRRASH